MTVEHGDVIGLFKHPDKTAPAYKQRTGQECPEKGLVIERSLDMNSYTSLSLQNCSTCGIQLARQGFKKPE